MSRPHTAESLTPRLGEGLLRTADLRSAGLSKNAVRAAVALGLLIRIRRGAYVRAGTAPDELAAAEAGGRVACLSVLQTLGIFVRANDRLHLHFEASASKYKPEERTVRWHWTPLLRTPPRSALRVEVIDALVQSTICQSPRDAIATLDSALYLRYIEPYELDAIFARVPARRRILRPFVDGRAESGPESIVRLIAVMLGFDVKVQVWFRGVGRVDLVLDGWLVVECDSRAHHTGWASQKRDRRRDIRLAARGMASLRPIAEDILGDPDGIADALRGLRDARRMWGRTAPGPTGG